MKPFIIINNCSDHFPYAVVDTVDMTIDALFRSEPSADLWAHLKTFIYSADFTVEQKQSLFQLIGAIPGLADAFGIYDKPFFERDINEPPR